MSAAIFEVGSATMTRDPTESNVYCDAEGSVAVTRVALGFQPFIPALTTACSLLFPRLRPDPITPMLK